MKRFHSIFLFCCFLCVVLPVVQAEEELTYPIVDTGQNEYFNNSKKITKPRRGQPFYGQDAQYKGNKPSYKKNSDGTVTDRITGLMWTSDPGEKMYLREATEGAKKCNTGGYSDWRVPTIKELYSLIQFNGVDLHPTAKSSSGAKPFIDTKYFKFVYGDAKKGERIIDSQFGSSTIYKNKVMWGYPALFGVNFADGRIKGYPMMRKKFYFFYVRGNPEYGKNHFMDNGDGTVTDTATGLMWMQVDSGELKAGDWKMGGLSWQQALEWTEKLKYAGHSDWRLPNIKELQSIVDYTRCPKITNSPAIDPVFKLTALTDESGKQNYPFYWSNTTHMNGKYGTSACYIAMGEALGKMKGLDGKLYTLDVHGAGAQRSDPKMGLVENYANGRGPQGDVVRIYNFVLAVRDAK